MFPPFRASLSIRLGLLLAAIDLVLGQGSSGRYDVLRGTQGESACTLQSTIVGKCTSSGVNRRDPSPSSILNRDETSPVPSSCTCSTIFFNIWSACLYSTGNDTLPNLTQWTQKCTTSTVHFESSTVVSNMQVLLGLDIPTWATLTVPGNTFFDLQRAVLSSLPIRWTLVQIILPVVAAVSTLTLSVVAFLIYGRLRKSSQGDNRIRWPKGLKQLRLRKATTSSDRQDSWEIDQESAMEQSSFVNFAPSVVDNKFPGQQPIRELPVFNPEPKVVHESEKPPMRPRSFRIPKASSMRLWKRKPPHIKLVPATPRFRVDDVDKSAHTCSVDANAGEGRNVSGEVNEEEEAEDDVAQYISLEDEETTNLITHSEERSFHDDVLLISKDGRPFTLESRSTNTVSVNSHIKIVSPSVSSASPRSAMQPIPTKPALYIPIPPPPPNHAAPAPPPTIPRSTLERHSDSKNGPSSPYFLHHSTILSPIKEASPSRSNSSSNVSLRRSLALRRSLNSGSVSSSSSLRTSPAARSSPNLGTSNPTSPPDYFDLHRTASQTSNLPLARPSEGDQAPLSPPAHSPPYLEMSGVVNGHRSWLSTDENASSLYCTSPEHVDPAAFFPGPVRAAGYPKTSLPTRDPSV